MGWSRRLLLRFALGITQRLVTASASEVCIRNNTGAVTEVASEVCIYNNTGAGKGGYF